jgi:hypothetical protein
MISNQIDLFFTDTDLLNKIFYYLNLLDNHVDVIMIYIKNT